MVELVFWPMLAPGGKFDKGEWRRLQLGRSGTGVGVSVTNALATRLEAQVHRDGQVATLVFRAAM